MKYRGGGMALAALLAALAWVPDASAAGNAEAGQGKAVLCQACHGARGISAIAEIPSLAGQTDLFLQWQLVFFRTGRRANPIMSPLSKTLTDEDIHDLGAYFATLPPPAATADADPALSAIGKNAAEAQHCAACHTEAFTGKQAAARLANQQEAYLAKALADYRSANRPSTGVAAMTQAASALADDDIGAIAHYLAALP